MGGIWNVKETYNLNMVDVYIVETTMRRGLGSSEEV
jgi:hypothetical protein